MTKKVRKAIGALLLAIAIAVTQIPASDVGAASSDFQMDGSTLVKYSGTGNSVSIPDSVKVIGPEAFANNKDIANVSFPDTLKTIDDSAFASCISLQRIDLPDSVESIGREAFSGCKNLRTANLGAGLTSFGTGVFSGCLKLPDVSIGGGNTHFLCEDGAIYSGDKSKLYEVLAGRESSSYEMPSSVSEIEKYAFWGDSNLTEVGLSSNLSEIPGYAFSNCSGITDISVPYSVKTIDMKAFENCISLSNISIPISVSFIHETAFDGCRNLNIDAEAGSYAKTFSETLDTSYAANTEYEDAASDNTSTEETVSGNNLDKEQTSSENELSTEAAAAGNVGADDGSLGQTLVVGGNAVLLLNNKEGDVRYEGVSLDGTDKTAANTDNYDAIEHYSFDYANRITDQAYYNNKDLLSYSIPTSTTSIGDFAFARSNLLSIAIPEGVTDIGYGAFYHCDNLASVTIPNTVTTIEPAAFTHTKWLDSWESGGSTQDFYIVGDGILLDYKGTSSNVEVPEGVKQIAPEVFKDHMGITQVTLPNSLKIIGEDAFNGCNNLSEVIGGVKVTKVADRAFKGCNISTIKVPANVSQIGLDAYDLTNTGTDSLDHTVVFQGDSLPGVSYEKTATRLSNSEDRQISLNGVGVAVINEGVSDVTGTILDANQKGFRGIVCSITSESDGTNNGTAELKYCSLIPDETGNVSIPETVQIYGKTYDLTGTDADAAISQAMDEVASTTDAGASDVGITTSKDGVITHPVSMSDGVINVTVNNSNITNTDVVSASLANNNVNYNISINESDTASQAINNVMSILYEDPASYPIVAMDISMTDESGTIPIKKLGKQTMDITVPLPDILEPATMHVICTDDYGQVEELPFELSTLNDTPCVTFAANHFSPYALYSDGTNEGLVMDVSNTLLNDGSGTYEFYYARRKDASPKTGDYIDPKWFLAVGLAATGMLVFLWKKPEKVRDNL